MKGWLPHCIDRISFYQILNQIQLDLSRSYSASKWKNWDATLEKVADDVIGWWRWHAVFAVVVRREQWADVTTCWNTTTVQLLYLYHHQLHVNFFMQTTILYFWWNWSETRWAETYIFPGSSFTSSFAAFSDQDSGSVNIEFTHILLSKSC